MSITDEQLDKRAEEIAREVLPPDNSPMPGVISYGWYSREQSYRMHSYRFATRTALEVDRESLRIIEEGSHGMSCAKFDDLTMGLTGEECDCGLDAHVSTLRKRLGVEP